MRVEIEYLLALAEGPLHSTLKPVLDARQALRDLYLNFTSRDAQKVKKIEATLKHDVKAVECYLREALCALGLKAYVDYVHFGLTSQDVNNTAVPLLMRDFLHHIYRPRLQTLMHTLETFAAPHDNTAMLAHTHGQPATPTTVGKVFRVFLARLRTQCQTLQSFKLTAKFGGATGGFHAHYAAYPEVDWLAFADRFIHGLALVREQWTTQISNYDTLASLFHLLARINTILKDLCSDVWHYISLAYFVQTSVAQEVGSSTMPHKLNPIQFENAEGNLGLSTAILTYLATTLPQSRMQRDLTDSTLLRNVGVPCAHTMIALHSLLAGFAKLQVNTRGVHNALDKHWEIVTEAYQVILRTVPEVANPYDKLKTLSRGQDVALTRAQLHAFVDTLPIADSLKAKLKAITPHTYRGVYPEK